MLTASLIVLVLSALVLLSILAFEIWMFIDAIQNPKLTTNEKALWLVGMLLLHPFVAIAYFFVARKPQK